MVLKCTPVWVQLLGLSQEGSYVWMQIQVRVVQAAKMSPTIFHFCGVSTYVDAVLVIL